MTAIVVRRPRRGAKLNANRRIRKRTNWLKRNRAALEAYNAHIERDGVFSDGLRSF